MVRLRKGRSFKKLSWQDTTSDKSPALLALA
jgi:hypothetical protein